MKEYTIKAEHAAGVHSGGMDQTASIFGNAVSAMHIISFDPFDIKPNMQLPKGSAFVVGHSGVLCAKMNHDSENNGQLDNLDAIQCIGRYNDRVWECQVACHLLDPTLVDDNSTPTLAHVQYRLFGTPKTKDERIQGLINMIDSVHQLLSDDGYTMAELEKKVQIIQRTIKFELIGKIVMQGYTWLFTASEIIQRTGLSSQTTSNACFRRIATRRAFFANSRGAAIGQRRCNYERIRSAHGRVASKLP